MCKQCTLFVNESLSCDIEATLVNTPINGGGRSMAAIVKSLDQSYTPAVIRFLHAKGNILTKFLRKIS